MLQPELLLCDSRGVYIPRDFAREMRRELISGVSDDSWAILESGPDHEFYWDAWTEVTDHAIVTYPTGEKWHLYQDGDLWMIPEGMEWDDSAGWFAWPSEQEVTPDQ